MPRADGVILADARWIGMGGIGRFASEVLARLDGWVPLSIDGSPVRPLEPVRISLAMRRQPHDVFFSPGFVPPLHCPTPFVFTIHDLIHVEVPEESTVSRRVYYRLIVRRAARRARCVLTVSGDARRRIARWAAIPEDRIIVVGNGVSAAFTTDGPVHNPGYSYFLYVGAHKPHKNIPGLLTGFARLRSDFNLRLILAGSPQPKTIALAERLGVAARIEFSGPVDDAMLARLYRGALALVMPSFAEGFGLPAIEAMACGTPVVCSNTTSLPELAGDAAILVAPEDAQALADALTRVCDDAALRKRLRETAPRQAAGHRWDDVARRVATALEQARVHGG